MKRKDSEERLPTIRPGPNVSPHKPGTDEEWNALLADILAKKDIASIIQEYRPTPERRELLLEVISLAKLGNVMWLNKLRTRWLFPLEEEGDP